MNDISKEDKICKIMKLNVIAIGIIPVWYITVNILFQSYNNPQYGLFFDVLQSIPKFVASTIFIVEGIALIKSSNLEKNSEQSCD